MAFQLEGKLAGPWLRELEECWQSTLARQRQPILRVDLTGVTFVSAAGKACLAALHSRKSSPNSRKRPARPPRRYRPRGVPSTRSRSSRQRLGPDSRDLYREIHRELDRLVLPRVLEYTGGNQQQAALLLGITRRTLPAKLQDVGPAQGASLEGNEATYRRADLAVPFADACHACHSFTPSRGVAGKVDGQPPEQGSKPAPTLGSRLCPSCCAVSHPPGFTGGEEPCCRYSPPKRALQAPLSQPGCAFCIQVIPFYAEDGPFFTQKKCDFESSANAVSATLSAGGSLAGIASGESFVGIPVAYSSVR